MDLEKIELRNRIEAMSPDEVELIIKTLPSEPMINELIARFNNTKEQLDKIRGIAING